MLIHGTAALSRYIMVVMGDGNSLSLLKLPLFMLRFIYAFFFTGRSRKKLNISLLAFDVILAFTFAIGNCFFNFLVLLSTTIYLGRLKSKPLIPINDTEEFQKADDESAIVVTRLGS